MSDSSGTKKASKEVDKPLNSGIMEKPNAGVKVVLKYPHMSQNKKFVHKPFSFDQLSFLLLLAGEVRTIV